MVADQRATQKLLTAALNILKGFYAKKAAAALLQTEQPAGPPPPPGFDAYKEILFLCSKRSHGSLTLAPPPFLIPAAMHLSQHRARANDKSRRRER